MSMELNKETAIEKQKRLEKALRENLRKRKTQQRERQTTNETSIFKPLENSKPKA